LLVINRSKEGQDILLLSALDVLIECRRHGLPFGAVTAQLPRLFNQTIIAGKNSRHNPLPPQFYTTIVLFQVCLFV
jgi:hypothetical protein